jgi:hypothetical protein
MFIFSTSLASWCLACSLSFISVWKRRISSETLQQTKKFIFLIYIFSYFCINIDRQKYWATSGQPGPGIKMKQNLSDKIHNFSTNYCAANAFFWQIAGCSSLFSFRSENQRIANRSWAITQFKRAMRPALYVIQHCCYITVDPGTPAPWNGESHFGVLLNRLCCLMLPSLNVRKTKQSCFKLTLFF